MRYKVIYFLVVFTASAFSIAQPEDQSQSDGWFRLERTPEGRFYTAIKSYTNMDPKKPIITLVAATHFAGPDYFNRQQEILNKQELVLFEMPTALPTSMPEYCRKLFFIEEKELEDEFGLKLQYSYFTYDHPNFLRADLSQGLTAYRDYTDNTACEVALNKVSTVQSMNPETQNHNRRRLMEGVDLKPKDEFNVLYLREAFANSLLDEALDGKLIGSIAILYGAAHMARFEAHLIELGYILQDESWLLAFSF